MFASVYHWVERGQIIGGIGMGATIVSSYVAVYYLFALVAVL